MLGCRNRHYAHRTGHYLLSSYGLCFSGDDCASLQNRPHARPCVPSACGSSACLRPCSVSPRPPRRLARRSAHHARRSRPGCSTGPQRARTGRPRHRMHGGRRWTSRGRSGKYMRVGGGSSQSLGMSQSTRRLARHNRRSVSRARCGSAWGRLVTLRCDMSDNGYCRSPAGSVTFSTRTRRQCRVPFLDDRRSLVIVPVSRGSAARTPPSERIAEERLARRNGGVSRHRLCRSVA